jgi:hypothetical protein
LIKGRSGGERKAKKGKKGKERANAPQVHAKYPTANQPSRPIPQNLLQRNPERDLYDGRSSGGFERSGGGGGGGDGARAEEEVGED